MKQIVQNYKTGELRLAEVPVPKCGAHSVLVKTRLSLVSIGTEKSVINLAKRSLLGKAIARPEHVKRFIEKTKNEGFLPTFRQAMNRLDNPVPLGYSSAGVVVETGKNIKNFSLGQRVSCIGQGFASHAEVIAVPEIMCCDLPESVSFEGGAFGMLGIIALHGIRNAKLTFGENVGVIGLGLLGLLTVQMLKAYGCNVIATDIDPLKLDIARKVGIDHVYLDDHEFMERARKSNENHGLDAVILTLSTSSSKPIDLAVEVSRFGGRVVLVGVADIHPNRNELWEKEVELIVSKAAGPGSLEPGYESEGVDYAYQYVRWTQQRNLKEFIRLMEQGLVQYVPLITHRFPFQKSEKVYADIMSDKSGFYVGVMLEYSEEMPEKTRIKISDSRSVKVLGEVNVGIIGAGLFGKSVLIPELKKVKGACLAALATTNGLKAENVARRFGIPEITTDYSQILKNQEIQAVVILTPHSNHAEIVCASLEADKHVFVEKPICVKREELVKIIDLCKKRDKILLTGYNRRFSALAESLRDHFCERQGPLVINFRINSGYVKPNHWVHKAGEGGSRIIGEICHFVDFFQFLSGAMIERVFAEKVTCSRGLVVLKDNVVITLKLSDGSVGNIMYSASGDRACPRERVEVFGDGRTAILEEFRTLTLFSEGKKQLTKKSCQDMGYASELSNLINSIRGEEVPLLSPDEIFNSMETVFAIDDSLATGLPQNINI